MDVCEGGKGSGYVWGWWLNQGWGAGRGDARLVGSSLDDGVRKILSSAVICFHENLKIKFKIRSFASV